MVVATQPTTEEQKTEQSGCPRTHLTRLQGKASDRYVFAPGCELDCTEVEKYGLFYNCNVVTSDGAFCWGRETDVWTEIK